MSNMQKQLEKILRDSLQYTFDEEACVSILDVEKSAANLIANGVVIPSSEKLEFHSGCLARSDFGRLVGTCRDLGAMVWDAPSHGYTKDGIDYVPVDFLREPEEIIDAIRVVLSVFHRPNVNGGKIVQPDIYQQQKEQTMERNISIRKTTEICNCNSCGARNYESSQPAYASCTPKVEDLFALHIGNHCVHLCRDCLDELVLHIACTRGAEVASH